MDGTGAVGSQGTDGPLRDDWFHMSCDRFRDAISARADGEDAGLPDEEVDAHLVGCPACREFDSSARRMRRRLGVYPTDAVPDASRSIVQRTGYEDRRQRAAAVRWLLATAAIAIIAMAVPDFLTSDPHGHAVRHVGAFSLAYAAGLLMVAVRPARARTMLHVGIVLVAALAATTVYDVARGDVALFGESVHLVEVASVVLLWALSRPIRDGAAQSDVRASSDDGDGPGLRAVG